MRRSTCVVFALAVTLTTVVLTSVSPSGAYAAEGDAPSPDTRRQASALFARGEALYRIGDYARAAALFEEAHQLAPHPDILWNAARSYDRAGDHARAANAYADYLAASEETSPDRKDATNALERLSKKLGRIEIHAPSGAAIFVDGAPTSSSRPYVSPGSHALRIVVDGREDVQTVAVELGTTRSVSAAAPAPPPPAQQALPVASPAATPPGTAGPPSRGWSPAVFAASAAVSAVATGVAIGLGVDTLNARSRFDDAPSQGSFDEGRDKQARTNVAIGVAGGLWALTAITGIWLVDWKGRSATSASAGASAARRLDFALSPGGFGAFGRFE